MKCPKDGTKLERVEILSLELDKCHKCDGLWFDRGELDRIRDAKVPDIEEVLEQKYGDPDFEEGELDAYMPCPRCDDAKLMRHNYTYTRPVSVDCCTTCYGIWLDDGELNAIVGEKKTLEQIKDPGRLHGFLKAMGRLIGRGD